MTLPTAPADDLRTMREARRAYFDANGFGDGGYDDRWVKLQAGPLPIWFPNTAERVRSVRLHDLHHVVTGYATDWTGEAEIGAWEIASGCRDHYAAWLLNLFALAAGLVIAPASVWHAFRRGRHSRNLYGNDFHEALLTQSVGSLRRRLGLGAELPAARAADALAFAGWSLVAAATMAAGLALLVAPVVLLVRLAALRTFVG